MPEVPTPDAQDTTIVALPDLSLGAYRAIVAQLQAEQPAARARIGRALPVLLGCDIRAAGRLGEYLVQSCQDSGVYYRCTSWSCSCPDRARHAAPCKHSWALTILHAASAVAAYERAQARYYLTATGRAATYPPVSGFTRTPRPALA